MQNSKSFECGCGGVLENLSVLCAWGGMQTSRDNFIAEFPDCERLCDFDACPPEHIIFAVHSIP
jgi:hypothetical protein